jgi:hypothetical protein
MTTLTAQGQHTIGGRARPWEDGVIAVRRLEVINDA